MMAYHSRKFQGRSISLCMLYLGSHGSDVELQPEIILDYHVL